VVSSVDSRSLHRHPTRPHLTATTRTHLTAINANYRCTANADPEQGLCNANQLAAQLDKSYPGAAASLREGLQEISPSLA
jgi:hypothetical protein